MIRTKGVLIQKPDLSWAVQADCQASCKSCGVQKVCSGSQRQMQLDLPGQPQLLAAQTTALPDDHSATTALQAGSPVQLDIAEEELLRMTLLAYALPCFLLIVGAAFGDPFGDLWALTGAALGSLLGLLLSRGILHRHPPEFRLQATSLVPAPFPLDQQESDPPAPPSGAAD